jgi:uncharacterized protein with GYD domain
MGRLDNLKTQWRVVMPKYLLAASYTSEGAKGLLKDGGTKRRQAAEQAIKSAGGTLEAFYYAFGAEDAYVIVDAPDHATVAAASVTINASGAVTSKTIVLLTPEEIDQAVKKSVSYRAPGH